MMELDTHTIEIILLAIANIVVITGAYWKLKNAVENRPTYQKVEDMIRRDTCGEQRIEEIIKRDAFPKAEGASLFTEIKNIKSEIDKISKKLDSYFKPRKEIT